MKKNKLYEEIKSTWHSSGAWRRISLEDFILGLAEYVKKEAKKNDGIKPQIFGGTSRKKLSTGRIDKE